MTRRIPAGARLLAGYMVKRWRMYALLWAISTAGVAVQTVTPFMVRALLDDALPAREIGLVVVLVLAIGCAYGFHRFTVIANRIGRERGLVRTNQDLRTDIFARMIRRDGRFFDRQTSGELTDRLIRDTQAASHWAQHLVMKGFLGTIELAGPLIAAFILNWRMAAAMLALAPVLLLIRRFITPREQAALQTERQLSGDVRSFAQEAIAGRRFIRASHTHASAQARLRELNQRLLTEGSYRVTTLANYQDNMWMTARGLGLLLVFAVGIAETASGRTTPGTLAAFVLAAMLFYSALGFMLDFYTMLHRLLAPWRRIAPLLDNPPDAAAGRQPVRSGAPDVSFSNVSFAYTDDREAPLRDVSFEAAPGEFLAVVGPTGSGKTTVADLLMRFYTPRSGSVTLNGVDVSELSAHELRRVVGIVPQDTALLNESIRENLQIAAPEADEVELSEAMRAAELHEFAASLPDSYDTVIGDRGVRLSGGQRQRLAIARVLLQDPPLLILDEATSSLDSLTERRIQAALDRASEGRTVIAIAHRLATIINADRVLVLDGGRIVDQGTVTELRERDGLFRAMYDTQFAAAEA